MPYSPLHVYELQNTNAQTITNILLKVIVFGGNSPAAQYGAVRDGQKYFQQGITITPEPSGNRLIIKASDEDYEKLKEIIRQLDINQPQVAIEVLVVEVSLTDSKELSTQFRNKTDGSVLNNVNFQNSGLGGIKTNSTTGSLLANLISLATGAGNPIGTTLITV